MTDTQPTAQAHAISTVAVIGAGTMGAGIAQLLATARYDVLLADMADAAVNRGMETIRKNLDRDVDKGRKSAEERSAILSRIASTTNPIDAADRDLVIEAIYENLDAKLSIFREIGPAAGPHTILTSNTSSLSITALATASGHPDRFAGFHFFNPVPVLPLVEIVRGLETSDVTVGALRTVASAAGKTPVVVRDSPGFIVNRMLIPMINEAVGLVGAGVAGRDDVDTSMRLGASHPLGPLQLADLIGLDVCLDIMEALHRDLGEDRYRPAPLLRTMVAAGRLGRKSGRGFYEYGA